MIILEETRSFFNSLKKRRYLNDLFGDSLFLYFNVFKDEKNIILLKDEETALRFQEKLEKLTQSSNVFLFREWDKLFYDNTIPQEHVEGERINTLHNIRSLNSFFCLCTVKSFFSGIIDSEYIERFSLNIKKDCEIHIDDLADKLFNIGYVRVDSPEKAGDFSVRGEIVEIWTYNRSFPYRIDCPFDIVEKINLFDPDTNLNIKDSDEDNITILPCREIIKDKGILQEKYNNNEITLEELYNNYPDIYRKSSFLHKVIGGCNLFVFEEEMLKISYSYLEKEFSSFENTSDSIFAKFKDLKECDHKKIYLSNAVDLGEKAKTGIESCGVFNRNISELSEKLLVATTKGHTVWLCFPNRARLLRMKEILSEYSLELLDGNREYSGKNEVFGIVGEIRSGFFY